MNKVFYILILLFGLFLIFWAASFYYYNPTFVKLALGSVFSREFRLQVGTIFFWALLIFGLFFSILGAVGIYRLARRKMIGKTLSKK